MTEIRRHYYIVYTELYKSYIKYLLLRLYTNSQKSGSIRISVLLGIVSLIRKDSDDSIDNYRTTIPLNPVLNILDKMLTKMMVRVADCLIGEESACDVPRRGFRRNLKPVTYI